MWYNSQVMKMAACQPPFLVVLVRWRRWMLLLLFALLSAITSQLRNVDLECELIYPKLCYILPISLNTKEPKMSYYGQKESSGKIHVI